MPSNLSQVFRSRNCANNASTKNYKFRAICHSFCTVILIFQPFDDRMPIARQSAMHIVQSTRVTTAQLNLMRHLAHVMWVTCNVLCNRHRAAGLLDLVNVQQPLIVGRICIRSEITPTGWPTKLEVVVLTDLKVLCFNLTSFGYRKLRFLDRFCSKTSSR